MTIDSKCKICRRLGIKLFLKGERCYSQKCAMIKRPYSPGLKGKRRRGSVSEFSRELKEKQKLRRWYGLGETQFKKYVKEILQKARTLKGKKALDPEQALIAKLEARLDNVVFRLGLVTSRRLARQLVSHGYFLVNDHAVNIPSYQVKKGDEIKVRPTKAGRKIYQSFMAAAKRPKTPDWLRLDPQNLSAKVLAAPTVEKDALPAEIPSIFEYYSR